MNQNRIILSCWPPIASWLYFEISITLLRWNCFSAMIVCRAGTLINLRWSRTRQWAPGPRRTPRSSSSPSAHSRLPSRNIRMPIYALFRLSWSGRFLLHRVCYCLLFSVPMYLHMRKNDEDEFVRELRSRFLMQCFWSGFILICIPYRYLSIRPLWWMRIRMKLRSKYRLLPDQTKLKFYFRSKKIFSLVFNSKHFVRLDSDPIHLA